MVFKKQKYIIGIDEVGRGALAGKIFVAAVALRKNLKFKISAKGGSASGGKNLKLKDSKKLTPKQREIWFNYITRMGTDMNTDKHGLTICYAVANVSSKKIEI